MSNLPTPPKRNLSGKVVHTSQKEMIINFYKDTLIADPDITYDNLLTTVSTASGIGIGT
ncbi:DDE 3 domain-containing protein, partial [Aphis craccivora]